MKLIENGVLMCPRCGNRLEVTNLLEKNKSARDDEFDIVYCDECGLFHSPANMMFNNATGNEIDDIHKQVERMGN